MVYRPCDPYTLCGISSCFRLLSRTQRQIAHALLTRPPLIRGRSPVTVRLECVMHAASVHPEPGSNSLKNYNLSDLRSAKSFFRVLSLAFLLLEYFSMCFNEIPSHVCSCFEILLFNFQRPSSSLHKLVLVAATVISYHNVFHLSSLF